LNAIGNQKKALAIGHDAIIALRTAKEKNRAGRDFRRKDGRSKTQNPLVVEEMTSLVALCSRMSSGGRKGERFVM